MPDNGNPSLKSFDAYADRNGQNLGSDSALDVGVPARTQRDLNSDPMSEAEIARLASDFPHRDAREGGTIGSVEATEAETPPENLARISDPTPRPDPAAREAIDRATASVGSED
jgi:hypothetical protein